MVKRRYSPNKNALTKTKSKVQGAVIMRHETIQESTLKEEGAPVPYVSHESQYERSIGPVDATDFERGLLFRSAENLAEIAAVNFAEYETYRAALVASATTAVLNGTIRLGRQYMDVLVESRGERFVVDAVAAAYRPRAEVDAALLKERAEQRLGAKGIEKALQTEINRQSDVIQTQAERILNIRSMLVKGEAAEGFLRDFDYVTKLMTKPNQEQYEMEKQLDPHQEPSPLVDTEEARIYHLFRGMMAAAQYPIEWVKHMKLVAPQSGQISTIQQQQESK